MSKELVISANRHETKLAILEDDQLVEVYFQRSNEYSLAGSVHKGRVTRVLPGMQSAFVDLGLDRDTFLYVSDFLEETGEDIDRIPSEEPSRPVEERAAPAVEPSEPVEEAAPQAVPAAERTTERTAERTTERPDEGDGRDRRTRRSRRRRSRGRGFPESKYAAPEATTTAEPAAEEEGPDFAVLPGESLAKYSAPETGEQEQGSEEAESNGGEAVAGDERPSGAVETAEEDERSEENGGDQNEADLRADMAVIANDNPEEQPPANAIPDSPEHPETADREFDLKTVAQPKARKAERIEQEKPAEEESSENDDAASDSDGTDSGAEDVANEEEEADVRQYRCQRFRRTGVGIRRE